MSSTRHGGCLCGAVRLSISAESRWVAHCHCSLCRRAHGAAYVTWSGYPASAVEIDDPERRLHWFASSADSERGFCGHCGSTLLFRSARWADELHLATALLDDGPDREPQAHVYWESHVGWVPADDGLPKKESTHGG